MGSNPCKGDLLRGVIIITINWCPAHPQLLTENKQIILRGGFPQRLSYKKTDRSDSSFRCVVLFFPTCRRCYMGIHCCLFHHQVFKVIWETRCLKIGSDRGGRCGLVAVKQMVVSSITDGQSGLKGSYLRGPEDRG